MNPYANRIRQTLVVWLAFSLAFSPMVNAASVDFSDVPLATKKRPNPNIIFAIDDSGSMDGEISVNANDGSAWWYTAGRADESTTVGGIDQPGFNGFDINNVFVPPVAGSYLPNFNQAGLATPTWKKYIYLFPNGWCGPGCATRSYPDFTDFMFAVAPTAQFAYLRSPDYNKQYYDPTSLYEPWKPYNDGTGTCPSGTVTGTGPTFLCTPGNATPIAARSHPIYDGGTVSLTTTLNKTQTEEFIFRMYVGMVIPDGADYRECKKPGGFGADCDPKWETASGNLCIDSKCPTGTSSGFTKRQGKYTPDPSKYDHVEVAISYWPATYYISSTNPLAASYASFPLNAMNGTEVKGPDAAQLRRIEIRPTVNSYPKAVTRTDCAGATCTYAEELQNFANWYQYYRKRTLSLDASFGNAIDGLRALRGGFITFNTPGNATMYDFDNITDTTNDQHRLLGLIYRVKGDGGTPTRDSLDRLGQQFKRTDASAPITHKCQANGGFVITDGFAAPGGPTGFGNYDGQPAGAKGPSQGPPINPAFDAFYFNQTNSTKKTAPYADKFSDTLADIAMYYYAENLRPDLPKGEVPIKWNDKSVDADLNPNLHMNTYGLILGLRGLIFGVDAAKTADPYTNVPDWNALFGVEPRTLGRDPRAIDELWHATLNGRGAMLVADSPEETRNAVLDVINQVQNKGGAAAAVAVSNPTPITGDNSVYASRYNSGSWLGDLNAFLINVDSKSPDFGTVSATGKWDPSPRQRIANADWTKRLFATYDRAGKKAIRFEAGQLNAAQTTALTGGKGTVAQKIDFVKGDRSKEGKLFRSRGAVKIVNADGSTTWGSVDGQPPDGVAVLGDMVNAEPVFVGPPQNTYFDKGYSAFKSANKLRQKVVYQGANDGMVHAFSAANGAEMFAYLPSFGFDARQDSTPGLANLTDKQLFIHKFFVDATPVPADIDFDKVGNAAGGGAPNWRTVLVGGLGKGGRGWYALDVTNPAATTNDDVVSKVLWEFPSAGNATHTAAITKNVGYSFGKPILAKTKAKGWVVLVASGYENGDETGTIVKNNPVPGTGGDGRGHLFVLNPKTGDVIADLATPDNDGAASAADRQANPRGLAYISGYVANGDIDNTVEIVYGGDLYGNLWRFDLRDADAANWSAGVKLLATLKDPSGVRQLVTTEPELALVNGKRVVFVGTGKYFGDKDIPDTPSPFPSATQKQTMYALSDDLSATPFPADIRPVLRQRTATKTANTVTITASEVPVFNFKDVSVYKGWYVDLPQVGERSMTNTTVAFGKLTFTTNIPSGIDPCLAGGSSWLYSIDFATGTPPVIAGVVQAAGFLLSDKSLASHPVAIQLPNGSNWNLINAGGGGAGGGGVPPPGPPLPLCKPGPAVACQMPAGPIPPMGKRKSWRELIVQ